MRLDIVFIYGVLGALAVDFQAIYNDFSQSRLELVGVPEGYTRVSFWLVQFAHALLAGCLTVAFAESYPKMDPLTLVAVGGSSRLIVLKFGQLMNKNRGVD